MNSDAKLNILTEALAAAGASVLAIDARGDVAISTMNDAALSGMWRLLSLSASTV